MLDPKTGAVLKGRDTAGGDFLYRFHFELQAMPRGWARAIVGLAAMAMLVAIISGIITHKKIFKDFFTFRRKKGQRSWLDAHNVSAVLSLPFHIMITYSGLLLVAGSLMPWMGDDHGGGHGGGKGGGRGGSEHGDMRAAARSGQAAVLIGGAAIAPIQPMIAFAEDRWGLVVEQVKVNRSGEQGATIEIKAGGKTSLMAPARGPGGSVMTFDARTGKYLSEKLSPPANSAVQSTNALLENLHMARFAGSSLRWLFFVAGVSGTIMIGTGLVLWSVKRAEKRKGAAPSFGHRLVDNLNVGGVAGLILALVCYFWANRLLPPDLAERAGWERTVFFSIWGLAFLHPLVRPIKAAWIEQIVAAGILFAGIPILNAASGGRSLISALQTRDWTVAAFDLICLSFGAALLLTARILRNASSARGGTRVVHRAAASRIPMAEAAE